MKPEHMTREELIQYTLDNQTETGPYAVALALMFEAMTILMIRNLEYEREELEEAYAENERLRAENDELESVNERLKIEIEDPEEELREA